LVFQDNDICVPTRYAAELMALFHRGFEAARLHRFVFYASEVHTTEIFAGRTIRPSHPPDAVVQNCQGGSLAVEREAYFAVGGHDERFVGWGGEDNELFDRLAVRRLHDHAYMPIVHLFHAPQPGKAAAHPNTKYFTERMAMPACQRIDELSRRAWGLVEGPNLACQPVAEAAS
jgi:hypothetical protein